MKKVGTNTVNPEITNMFIKDLNNYTKVLLDFASGSKTVMPKENTNDILNKYVNMAILEFSKVGVDKIRAKSIAKYTLQKILDNEMEKVSF